ncbi:MAG: ATP-binding protein [Verrucomicrobiae bacterium]|nr:ATP-binding protein [Verrucomicrobiae bacterium]
MNLEQLQQNITRLETFQRQLGLKDAQFCRRYLGGISEKTWTHRLKAGKLNEVSDRMAERIGALVAALTEGAPGDLADFTPDLPFAKLMRARIELLRAQQTDRRCLVVLAPTGVGKTWFARWDRLQNPTDTIILEIRPSWRNKAIHILAGLATKLGLPQETSAAALHEAIVANLCTAPKLIYFDEGHEGGLALLKLIKALVNETPAWFVYLAYPSEWGKMLRATDGAYDEAKQLVGRSLKPIFDDYRCGTTERDVAVWLDKVAGLSHDARALAREITPLIRANFGLRTLADALADARAEADETGKPLHELLVPAVRALCGARGV